MLGVTVITGKIKKTGNVFQYSNYDTGVVTGDKKYDYKCENGKYWKKKHIMGSLPIYEEVKVGRGEKKDLSQLQKGELYSYLNNKSINIRRKIAEFKDLYLCNILKYQDHKGQTCLPKMITITFKNDIKDYEVAVLEMDKTIKRIQYFVQTRFDKNFKLRAVGVREVHKEKREGYHFHFIAFNLPYIDRDKFKKFGEKESTNSGRVEISVLKQFKKKYIDYSSDGIEEKISFVENPVSYLSKALTYLSKELDDLYKIDYSMDLREDKELMAKLKNELNRKTLFKVGKLIKPEVINLYSNEEFEHELNKAFDNYKFKDHFSFNTEFLGWIDLYKFVDHRGKSDLVDSVLDTLGFSYEYIEENENIDKLKYYEINKFFINYKENKLMYIDNSNFIEIDKNLFNHILDINDLSNEIKEFIIKNKGE